MPDYKNESENLRSFWKPDGTNVDEANALELSEWMLKNGLNTEKGAITMFLNRAEFGPLRNAAQHELIESRQSSRRIVVRASSEQDADRIVADFRSEGCSATKSKDATGWLVVAICSG